PWLSRRRHRRSAASRRTLVANATGSAGGRTWPSASGARCARTTRPTAPPGTTSPTTTRAAAPTAGARTGSSGSPTARAGSASRWHSGTSANPGPDAAPLHVLPTLWFRNTWSWGRTGEGYWPKARLARAGDGTIVAEHASLGRYRLVAEGGPELLFTDNETNVARLFGAPNPAPYVKDAFHDYVVHGRPDAVNPEGVGTKAACHYRLEIPAGGAVTLQLRLTADAEAGGPDPSRVFADRIREADAFYACHIPGTLGEGEQAVVRQAYASLLWSKKFYHYVVKDWLEGDPAQPPPPPSRREGRNHDWP